MPIPQRIKRVLCLKEGSKVFLTYVLSGAAWGSSLGFIFSIGVIDKATGWNLVGVIVMFVALGGAFGTIIGLVIALIAPIIRGVFLEEGSMFGAVLWGFFGLISGIAAVGVADSLITGKTTIVFSSGDIAIILGGFIGLVVGAIFGWYCWRHIGDDGVP